MNPFHDYIRYETRRQFLSRGSNAVSWAAFAVAPGHETAWLRRPRLVINGTETRPTLPDRGPHPGGPASFRPQGQAGDLSAHGRRAAADGHV